MLKNFNKPIINKREWQVMTSFPYNTGNGVAIVAPEDDYCDYALVVGTASSAGLYDYKNDSYEMCSNPGLAGTFGLGTCGIYNPWSMKYAATGGTTNSIVVASATYNITGMIIGKTLVVTSGAQEGFTTTVTGVLTSGGIGDIIVYLKDALPAALASGDTFKTMSGMYYVVNGGTKIANNFKGFDLGTRTWTVGLNNTALPNLTAETAMATAYRHGEYMASGEIAKGTSTTMTSARTTTREIDRAGNITPNWTVNQWKGYQVTITKDNRRQTRLITSNTATTLTVASSFLFTPDNTCTYKIEGDEDIIYLLGNNAVTLYEYLISANTWVVVSPTVARASVTGGGVTCDIPTNTKRDEWSNENDIKDGRYVYSIRGKGGVEIDRYDIVANKWEVVNTRTTETFNTGASTVIVDGDWYIKRESLNRFLKYSFVDNAMYAFSTIPLSDGAGTFGQKLHAKRIKGTDIVFVYTVANTSTTVYRTLLY